MVLGITVVDLEWTSEINWIAGDNWEKVKGRIEINFTIIGGNQ